MNSACRTLRGICSLVLCGTLWLPYALPAIAANRKEAAPTKLDKSAKAELLLSRFTFGPTEADRQSVQRVGAEAWLRRQLQPSQIDDFDLERRLDAYPALRMTQAERLQRYPDPATLRQLARSGALPADPESRAILSDQVEFYEMRQANKASAAGTPPVVRQPGGSGPVVTAPVKSSDTQPANLQADAQPMAKERMNAILAMSPSDRYGQLLSLPPADLIALRKAARGPLEQKLSEGMTPLQKETLLALSGTNRMITAEAQGARLLRNVYSRRQVEAVMTDFWLNHFNVYSGKNGQEPSLLPEFEKTIRAHALGQFEDLLIAMAQSPAMLIYLDNSTSTGPDSEAATRQRKNSKGKGAPGLNENYARELMELHTLGVNGGYTQQDVTEVAEVFTGWTLDRPNDGGGYNFNPHRHQPGTKVVLGRSIPEGGETEGLQVLHMLATRPATARFLSRELAQRFVSDAPPAAMIDRMANTFLSSNGDIRQVLLAMVHSPEFFTTTTVGAKLKTPLEYVTSAVRVSGADVTNPQPLVQALQQLGMPLYGCQPPTGYSWDSASWLSSSALVNRMNFALSLSNNRVGGVRVDWSSSPDAFKAVPRPITTSLPDDRDAAIVQKERLLEARLFFTPVSAQTRAAVLAGGSDGATQQPASSPSTGAVRQERPGQVQVGTAAATVGRTSQPTDTQFAEMAGLLLGSPEFQRR